MGEEDRFFTEKERRKKACRRRRGPYRKFFRLNMNHLLESRGPETSACQSPDTVTITD